MVRFGTWVLLSTLFATGVGRAQAPGKTEAAKLGEFILTADFPVTGRIVSPTLKARTAYFGDVDLRLPELRTLRLRGGSGEMDVVLDAAKHGSNPDHWYNTGFAVDAHARLFIS